MQIKARYITGGLGCGDLRLPYFGMETFRWNLSYFEFCLLSVELRWVVPLMGKHRDLSLSRSFCVPEVVTAAFWKCYVLI